MTRYAVSWDDAVEANFADAWLKSDSTARAKLTEIATTIDRTLTWNAESQGELQADSLTRAVILEIGSAKITIYFEVIEEDRRVLVRRFVFQHQMGPR